jgi:hypothetical protein
MVRKPAREEMKGIRDPVLSRLMVVARDCERDRAQSDREK